MQQSQLVREFNEAFQDALALKKRYQQVTTDTEKLSQHFANFKGAGPTLDTQDIDLNEIEGSIKTLGMLGEQLNNEQQKYHQLVKNLEQTEKAERQKKTKMIIIAVVVLWVLYLVF